MRFAPPAIKWLNQVASEMATHARRLSSPEQQEVEVGVKDPTRVRIALVEEMPLPHDEPFEVPWHKLVMAIRLSLEAASDIWCGSTSVTRVTARS